MFNRILFLRKSKDKFADQISNHLKKKSKYLKIILTDKKKVNISKQTKYDYIFSFRSHYILKKKLINKAVYAAINFHPGPPKYRGIGCVNYALYENSKYYGATAHIIDKKIDNGNIINAKIFKIKKNDSVESLLERTYKVQVKQFKNITDQLIKNHKNLQKMLNSNKKIKWSKKIRNKAYLNKFYEINKNISLINLKKKIRSTITKKYKPYIKIHGLKFIYNV